jgi:hypothetical protein
MTRRQESAEDLAALVIGTPIFMVVAATTAAVMAVGFVAIEAVDRMLHH